MAATTAGLVSLGALLVLLAVVYVPFGNYLAAVYTNGRHWRIERTVYRVVGVDPDAEQRWTGYALAGSLAAQKRVAPGAGTLPTTGPLFGVLVGGTVVLVAALTFFPALALGPIAEALG